MQCSYRELVISTLVYGLLMCSSMLSVVEMTVNSISASQDLNRNDSSSPPDFTDIVYVFEHFLHLIENGAMFVGIVKFHLFMKKSDNYIKVCNTLNCNYTNKWKYGILFSLTIDISYTVMKLTPVIFFITLEPPFSCNRVYSITMVFILVINGIKLLPMIVLTTFIRFIWLTKLKKLKGRLKNTRQVKEKFPNASDLADSQLDKLKDEIKDYKDTGKCLASVHGMFSYWFVIRWISFFISIVFNSLMALKLILRGIFSNFLWARTLVLFSNIVSFIILYFCGNIMNHYHQKYRSKLKKYQKRLLFGKIHGYTFQRNFIPKKEKYNFTPSILWIKVPLGNPGYIISILLALISFFFSTTIQYF